MIKHWYCIYRSDLSSVRPMMIVFSCQNSKSGDHKKCFGFQRSFCYWINFILSPNGNMCVAHFRLIIWVGGKKYILWLLWGTRESSKWNSQISWWHPIMPFLGRNLESRQISISSWNWPWLIINWYGYVIPLPLISEDAFLLHHKHFFGLLWTSLNSNVLIEKLYKILFNYNL